jgi:hypothetical protein
MASKALELLNIIIRVRISYGKDTIFNRIFECSKMASSEQKTTRFSLFLQLGFRVNPVLLRPMAIVLDLRG